jgi:hypothetical protein
MKRGASNTRCRLSCARDRPVPGALRLGDLAGAKEAIDTLKKRSREFGLPLWARFGRHFEGVLIAKAGDLDEGLRLTGFGVDDFTEARFRYLIWNGVSELAKGFVRARRFAERLKQAGEAGCGTQLPGQRAVSARLIERLKEESLRHVRVARIVARQEKLALEAQQLRRQRVVRGDINNYFEKL